MRLKLLSYNIRFGGVGREALLAEVIRSVSPDIVVFQEATVPRTIETIAKETGLPHWDSRTDHSLAFCSRIEIAHHEWHTPRGSRHRFLEIQPDGTEMRIFGIHLRAQVSKWGEKRRTQEVKTLLNGIQKYQHGFHVLVGDFNSLAPDEILHTKKMPYWIRALILLSGRNIQRATIQCLLDRGYSDAFRSLYKEEQGYTFPTADPHLRFDYLFLPVAFLGQIASCEVIKAPPAPAASDHFPLLTVLNIPS